MVTATGEWGARVTATEPIMPHPGARLCHRPVAAAAGYRLAELAAGGDLEQAMASEAISSQLKRLTQNWTICVQAREPPTRKSAARITRVLSDMYVTSHPCSSQSNHYSQHQERPDKLVTYYRTAFGSRRTDRLKY